MKHSKARKRWRRTSKVTPTKYPTMKRTLRPMVARPMAAKQWKMKIPWCTRRRRQRCAPYRRLHQIASPPRQRRPSKNRAWTRIQTQKWLTTVYAPNLNTKWAELAVWIRHYWKPFRLLRRHTNPKTWQHCAAVTVAACNRRFRRRHTIHCLLRSENKTISWITVLFMSRWP